MLSEFEKDTKNFEKPSGIQYPDPKKRETAKDEVEVVETDTEKSAPGVVIPEYLKEIENDFASIKVTTASTELVDAAYADIIKTVLEKFRVELQDEVDNVQPAPFNKDGELSDELEARFKLTRDVLTLDFNKRKNEILTSAEADLTQLINSVLAKNGTYQRLSTAYTNNLEHQERISPEQLYDYKAENTLLIEQYALDKDAYLDQVAEQYDAIHLPELKDTLSNNANGLLDGVLQRVEDKVQPTKTALSNALKPELLKRKVVIFNNMLSKLDDLEDLNLRETSEAIDSVKRAIRRETRRAESMTSQIHVSKLTAPTSELEKPNTVTKHQDTGFTPYTPVREVEHAQAAPAYDAHEPEAVVDEPAVVKLPEQPVKDEFQQSLASALTSQDLGTTATVGPIAHVSPWENYEAAAPVNVVAEPQVQPEPKVEEPATPDVTPSNVFEGLANPMNVFEGLDQDVAPATPTTPDTAFTAPEPVVVEDPKPAFEAPAAPKAATTNSEFVGDPFADLNFGGLSLDDEVEEPKTLTDTTEAVESEPTTHEPNINPYTSENNVDPFGLGVQAADPVSSSDTTEEHVYGKTPEVEEDKQVEKSQAESAMDHIFDGLNL